MKSNVNNGDVKEMKPKGIKNTSVSSENSVSNNQTSEVFTDVDIFLNQAVKPFFHQRDYCL